MQYRKFGNTDLLVSEIGFGAWAIGGAAMIGNTAIGWGETDDKESARALDAAVGAGINFFDSADIYGLGHSEELIGKTLARKTDLLIASKVGNVSRNNQFTVDYGYDYIIQACEKSLKRLKRDRIDFYQLHTARLLHFEQGDCIRAMEDLKQQGKIRYWGLSLNTFDPLPEAQWLLKNNLGSGFQLVFNLINKTALELFDTLQEKGYGIIARMPLQFGLLTGKFDSGFNFPENDHRQKRITKDIVDQTALLFQDIWALCEKYSCTKTQLALSYILSYKQVSTIIPGIRTEEQVMNNTSGLMKITADDHALIESINTQALMDNIKLQG